MAKQSQVKPAWGGAGLKVSNRGNVKETVATPPPPPERPAGMKPALADSRGSFVTRHSKVIWPTVALIGILLFNFFFTADFFKIQWRDGHLDGNLINVLKNGAPVMLLSLGMTLVIATAGIDLSVGSVMAISGAMAGVLIA